ncbi:MAG: ABC transporter substrate-binding protein [Phycisphaerae bacterium]|nr:ABC transporter substrate-binding protein [Gemmatimonadaceae bacterium]
MSHARRSDLRRMQRRAAGFALLCLTMGGASPGQPHPASPAAELLVAIEDAADLWSRVDGTGFANDVVIAAFRAAHVPIRLTVVPYARCKQLVLEGAVVACASMSRDRTSSSMVRFPSVPLFVCYTELLENSAKPLNSTKLSALARGTRVGVVLGYEYPAALDTALRAGNISVERAPSELILMRKLAAGRVDAALMNLNDIKSLAYISAATGLTAKMLSRGRVGTLESYLGFSLRHPQSAGAMSAFEAGMRTIRANGELAAISGKWTDTSFAVIRGSVSRGRGG